VDPAKTQWSESGYVIVPDLLSEIELRELSAMADQLLDGELKPELPYKGQVPDEFYTFWEPGLKERNDLPRRERVRLMSRMVYHHPYFRRFAAHPAIYDVLAEFFGSGVQIFSDTIFMKPARHGIAAAPHQDTAFWPKLRPNAINFWMAIDPATIENGCLYILPGSHRYDLPHQSDPVMRWYLAEDQADFSGQVPVELSPGSAIFFDSGLIHRSYPNHSDKSRRSMTAIYVAENVVHEAPWTHTYHFELLTRGGN